MTGVPPTGSGSRASHEAASASSPKASIPNATWPLESREAMPASYAGSCDWSIAISLKRIADMMEEDRKPRLELLPEGYIGEQEHRRFMHDSFIRDLTAWETIADAVIYIAGRMPLPASAIEARSDATTKIGAAEGESAAPKGGDAQ